MKRQITCLLAVCMLSALLCGCGRSEKQTAGTKPTAPVQTAAATEAPEPQTLGDIPDVDDIVRCYKELVNGNYGVEYDSSAPLLPGGFDGVGEWYPVTNYGSLSELRRHVQQYLSDALMEQRHFGDSLQEVDGKLYWQQGSKGYVRYRVDRQEALTRDETLDAQYGGKCYQTSLELYGSADNYCGDEAVVFRAVRRRALAHRGGRALSGGTVFRLCGKKVANPRRDCYNFGIENTLKFWR